MEIYSELRRLTRKYMRAKDTGTAQMAKKLKISHRAMNDWLGAVSVIRQDTLNRLVSILRSEGLMNPRLTAELPKK